jgi:hypothetical protein
MMQAVIIVAVSTTTIFLCNKRGGCLGVGKVSSWVVEGEADTAAPLLDDKEGSLSLAMSRIINQVDPPNVSLEGVLI